MPTDRAFSDAGHVLRYTVRIQQSAKAKQGDGRNDPGVKRFYKRLEDAAGEDDPPAHFKHRPQTELRSDGQRSSEGKFIGDA